MTTDPSWFYIEKELKVDTLRDGKVHLEVLDSEHEPVRCHIMLNQGDPSYSYRNLYPDTLWKSKLLPYIFIPKHGKWVPQKVNMPREKFLIKKMSVLLYGGDSPEIPIHSESLEIKCDTCNHFVIRAKIPRRRLGVKGKYWQFKHERFLVKGDTIFIHKEERLKKFVFESPIDDEY